MNSDDDTAMMRANENLCRDWDCVLNKRYCRCLVAGDIPNMQGVDLIE